MIFSILEVAFLLFLTNANAYSTWQQQRDNLSEYRMISSMPGMISELNCMIVADRINSAHTVTFDAASGICSMFQCIQGDGGCRKCRNANNSNMSNVWVRTLSLRKNCWTTFQHRVDASVSFNRNWSEYTNGFGQGENLNYWMGLEKLYSIMSAENCATTAACRLRWEFSDWSDTWYWVENTNFSVASSSDKYRLTIGVVDAARSKVGQTPLGHNFSPYNRQFSTPDSDNDACPSCSCAVGDGWWYGWCGEAVPNGFYYTYPFPTFSISPMRYAYSGSPAPLSLSYSMKSFELLLLVE